MRTRAVRMHGASDLRLDEFELREINDDEILASVVCDSVCMSTYKAAKLGKQLKAASQSNATECIIMGDEFIEKKELIIKDLARGEQRAVGIDEFLATIESSTK